MKQLQTLSPIKDERSRIKEAAKIIQTDLSLHYSILELSSMVMVNRKRLQDLFLQEYGMGPYSYLQELRLSKAKEMLLADQSIRRISITVGFSGALSISNFTKFFKKSTGHSPIAWKELEQSRAAI
jgi:transcriptional regulator GlxA family with amidase domain